MIWRDQSIRGTCREVSYAAGSLFGSPAAVCMSRPGSVKCLEVAKRVVLIG